MPQPHRRARRAVTSAAVIGTVAALTLVGVPRTAAQPLGRTGPGDHSQSSSQRERKGDFDARNLSTKQQLRAEQKVTANRRAASQKLDAQLGVQGVQQTDPSTGTPRMVGRLDNFLSKPSKKSAETVVLNYVKAHLAAFGLKPADLDTFVLTRRYVDIAGISHISWSQTVDGVTVFGNGLKGNVTKRGELISIQGSPISGLADLADAAGTRPSMSATQARTRAAADVGGSVAKTGAPKAKGNRVVTWSNADRAQLVWFYAAGRLRLGWSTYVQAGGTLSYQHVIDAANGSVLYRHDTVDNERTPAPEPVAPGTTTIARAAGAQKTAPSSQAATSARKGLALVYNNYPGAAVGGKQQAYDLVRGKLISPNAATLSGYYVNAFADVNDDNAAGADELVPVPGSASGSAQYKLTSFNDVNSLCSPTLVCTWDPTKAGSWVTNGPADVTQGFFQNSMFHNYLVKSPFGFTPAAGNFDTRDGDAVQLNALDGANTALDDQGNTVGLPDVNHIDNANMSTPPDGIAPTMQMYLFHAPGATNEEDSSLPTSSSFDASVIFHEYTHGLSNRLVVDATGNSTLNSIQAGSLGEAWSDYYALDRLVTRGLERDTKASGDVLAGKYVEAGTTIRTMGIDCPVTTTSSRCTQGSGATGGYTYGDFSSFDGGAEVHRSGEIWGQTLWDLRAKLGHTTTGMVVTRAMELSPADPSFLDMRNSILQADRAVYGGKHLSTIWGVFAHRGLGFFAGSLGSGDTQPAEDFSKAPAKGAPKGSLTGRVLNGLTGQPVAGAVVAITGHDAGFAGGSLRRTTDASGRYSFARLPVGTYAKVAVIGPGYEVLTQPVTVKRGATTATFRPRRDWAASSGGAEVTSFNGPDYSPFCGPDGAIDLSQGRGWGSTTGDDDGTPTNVMIPKSIVVHLPAAITLSSFGVDPSNTCGDAGSSSTGQYRIDTSPNGTTWTQAAAGTFTAEDRGRLNEVSAAAATGVAYVRFTIQSPQVPDFATNCPEGAYNGCVFADLTELEVFGTR